MEIQRKLAAGLAGHSLHDVRHINAIRHDAPQVVFHELRADAVFLKLFSGAIFF